MFDSTERGRRKLVGVSMFLPEEGIITDERLYDVECLLLQPSVDIIQSADMEIDQGWGTFNRHLISLYQTTELHYSVLRCG